MTQQETWNVGRLLSWTADYLKEHGSDSARLDAEVLLAHCLKCQRIELYTSFDREPDAAQREEYRSLVRKRADGVPVAYLVGHREFYSLDFLVSPAVLIPRPETEFVVITLLDLIKRQKSSMGRPWRLVDVGTGSGILAICAAKYISGSQVWGIDISREALAVAEKNVAKHSVGERVKLMQSDLFASVPANERFDFVLSNPPYIGTAEQGTVDEEVRRHEPDVALFAGDDGLAVIRPLITQAAERTVPGGWLLMEISPLIEQKVRKLFHDQAQVWDLKETGKDLAGHARVIVAQRRE